jgi:tetratricopeptide (TPR) repeat protein
MTRADDGRDWRAARERAPASQLLGRVPVRHVLPTITLAAVVAAAHAAHADPARALAARGRALARQGRWTAAIEAFKRADRVTPRARHACLIGLAYLRRELWTQADLFLERCRERASHDDPAPAWLPMAERQLQRRSASAHLAPIDVRIEPASVSAAIALSGFALDEHFMTQQLRLPRGVHVITATAPALPPVRAVVEITDSDAQEVVLRFAEPHPSRVPTGVMVAGGAVLASGLAYHAFARDEEQPVTYGLIGAGSAALLTGLILEVAHHYGWRR